MRPHVLSLYASAVLAAFTSASASPDPSAIDAPVAARLQALRQAPESAGRLIYRGAVFAQHSGAATPLFNYERRVAVTAAGLSAAHVTRDVNGEPIIAEQAEFTPSYSLQRFEAINAQLGTSGSVRVSAAAATWSTGSMTTASSVLPRRTLATRWSPGRRCMVSSCSIGSRWPRAGAWPCE